MENKKTGFWIRLLSRLIDLAIIFSFMIISSVLMLEKIDGQWQFKENWMFYLWIILLMTLVFILFILLPVLLNGITLGMFITRIKIKFKDDESKWRSILVREMFFSISWIFICFLIMSLINHSLIIMFTSVDKKWTERFSNLSPIDKLRVNLVTSLSAILIVIQFIYVISIIVRGEKKGLHDTHSNTSTIWVNKWVEKQKNPKQIKISPRPVNNNSIDWI